MNGTRKHRTPSVESEDVILAFHKPPGTSARGVRQNSTPDKEPSECIDDIYRHHSAKSTTRSTLNGANCGRGVSISGFMGAQ